MKLFKGLFNQGNPTVKLNEVGKQKHDNMLPEGIKLDLLVYLNDNGESTIREIAKGINTDESKTKNLVNWMVREGWVDIQGGNQ